MYSLRKITLFLMLLAQASSELRESDSHSTFVSKAYGSDNHCSNDSTCPTWFTCNAEKRCQCDKRFPDRIICDDRAQVSAVLLCNCVTYDNESKSTSIGSCFYYCQQPASIHKIVVELPSKPENLINNSACTPFHRTGLLCGDCEQGHSPLVFSYNLSCVKCPNGDKNWWKFILAEFLPITIFYLLILVFNINVTSSRLHGVVWYSQLISAPPFIRVVLYTFSVVNKQYLKPAKVGLVFYSLWNLDIFRSVLPDICLNVTTLQALALEYFVALYPFVLILLSYILIELHDRQISLVVTLWKPFKNVLFVFRKSWDIRTSVLDSFATFFLLSYNKVVSVTFDILTPTKIHELHSDDSTYGLYYSPSVAYFGDEHLPYAILAIINCTLFMTIPTLIFVLYPCNCFQKFLSFIPINWYFLHTYVDAFQGSYKDGTELGTLDYRWFSVIMLLLLPLLLIIHCLTFSFMFFVYGLVTLLILAIAMVNMQPLKKDDSQYPLVDLIFTILLCCTYIAILGRAVGFYERQYHFAYNAVTMIAFLTVILPLLYTSFVIVSWLLSKLKICIAQLNCATD